MPKLQITKELINSIVNQKNTKFVKTVNKRVNEVLSLAVDNLSSQISYINLKNVLLQPVNELVTNAFVDNSNFVYFLGINNAQLEMNTAHKMNFWKNFKERFKYAWKNRKDFGKRKRKRRKKKLKYEEEKQKDIKIDPSKYSIYNLAEDMQNSICNYLYETSMISCVDNCLQIVGKDDFGTNTSIIIYLVHMNETGFKYYAGFKKGFIDVNVNKRIENVNQKINLVGENYVKILKVFNTLFYNVNGYMPNQVFMESILNYCPNELYESDDIFKVYLKIVNYLSLKTIRNIKSINNEAETIHEDKICGNCGIGFNKMLEMIK